MPCAVSFALPWHRGRSGQCDRELAEPAEWPRVVHHRQEDDRRSADTDLLACGALYAVLYVVVNDVVAAGLYEGSTGLAGRE